jgi:hypothetical protein
MKPQSPLILKLRKPRNPVAIRLQQHRAAAFKDKRAERGGAKKNDWKWDRGAWE